MSEVWETFDDLFQTLSRQERRVAELEIRLVDLEQRLQKNEEIAVPDNVQPFPKLHTRPLEQAA